MKKLFASFIFGILVTGLTPFGIMDAYAQPILYGISYLHQSGGLPNPATLYTINPSTGNGIAVGPIGFNNCSGMDQDPATGIMYATCKRTGDNVLVLVTINLSTGQGTEIGAITGANVNAGIFNGKASDITFRNSDSTLYGFGGPDGPLFTLNINSGAATQVGPFPSPAPNESGNSLAFSLADILYYSENDPPNLFTLDQNNAAQNLIAAVAGTSGPNPRFNAFDFNPSTGVLFASFADGPQGGTHSLMTIDLNTNTANLVGLTVDGLDAIAFAGSDIVGGEFSPIDSTALMIAGLQSSAIWMLPILVGAVGVGSFYIKSRMNKD